MKLITWLKWNTCHGIRKISYCCYRSNTMSRRVLGKLSLHSLICLPGASPSFSGAGCQLGCLQSWQENSCGSRSRSTLMPTSAAPATRICTLHTAKLPTMYAAAPQTRESAVWPWLKWNIQPKAGGNLLLWVFLWLFSGRDENTQCFLPQVDSYLSG